MVDEELMKAKTNKQTNKARKVEEKLVFNFIVGNVVSMGWWGKYLHEVVENVLIEVCISHVSVYIYGMNMLII